MIVAAFPISCSAFDVGGIGSSVELSVSRAGAQALFDTGTRRGIENEVLLVRFIGNKLAMALEVKMTQMVILASLPSPSISSWSRSVRLPVVGLRSPLKCRRQRGGCARASGMAEPESAGTGKISRLRGSCIAFCEIKMATEFLYLSACS